MAQFAREPQRDSVPDRIGNIIRTIGYFGSAAIIIAGVTLLMRGEIAIFDPKSNLDFVLVCGISSTCWLTFKALDYLISGRW